MQTEPTSVPKESHPPYLWAAVATLAVGLLYGITLAPTTAFWDASEYITAAHIVGIPHPPGNPLFVILARSWDVLLSPLGLSTAVRINLFSAAMSALAHGFWFLVVHHVLRYFSENRNFRLIGAGVAILISATAFTVWSQSNVLEKVYTVSLFTIALITWLLFRWQEGLGKRRNDNILILIVFILALSVGNHLMTFLAAPAIVLFVLFVRPVTLLNYRFYLAGVAVVVLGLSVHMYLPLRSELEPIINEGQPVCESVGGAIGSIVTYGNVGCTELNNALKRRQYQKPPLMPRLAPLPRQLQNWLQYFDWQWARGINGDDVVFGKWRSLATGLFIVLGLLGFIEHYRRDKKSWLYFVSLGAVLIFGLVFYMNFRYGYTAPGTDNILEREVRERDYFFIAGFSVWGLVAGIGLASLWQRLSQIWQRPLGTEGSLWVGAPVLLLALIPLVFNYERASRNDDYSARDWAYNLLMSIEPYGLIFTNGDNDTFPLWYLQEVEGVRRDVTVAVTSYMNTPWYVKQLRKLTTPCEPGVDPGAEPTRIICQRPYEPLAENTNAMYTHDPLEAVAAGKLLLQMTEPVREPTRSIFPDYLTDERIDQVAGEPPFIVGQDSVDLGAVTATFQEGETFFAWHRFTISAISTSLGDRPVYFASSGSAATVLGLREYVVRHGVAFKLWEGLPQGVPGIVRLHEDAHPVLGPWLNPERTQMLLENVFVHRSGLPDEWEFWPDHSTHGIPSYYSWPYLALYMNAALDEELELAGLWRERALVWSELGEPAEH